MSERIEDTEPVDKSVMKVTAGHLLRVCYDLLEKLTIAGHPQPAISAYLQRLLEYQPWVPLADEAERKLAQWFMEREWKARNADPAEDA